MKEVTLIFPGQGSQYVGMGKEFLEKEEYFKYDELKSLDFNLPDLMIQGPEEKLQLTEYTQPSIVLYSTILFRKLKKVLDQKDIKIAKVLGHSVGEYSALVAAESLELKDAIKAVHLRGQYMQAAVPEGLGAMYAIIRVPQDIVQKACVESSTSESKVMCANFNEPGQTVISGHKTACEKAVAWLKDNYQGKQLALPLKVSAPFHSELMKPAEDKLATCLKQINFSSNKIPYIANIDATEYKAGTNKDIIIGNLTKQVCASVLWYQSIETLSDTSTLIEVGPGKVLSGLNKKINRNLKCITLDTEDAFSKIEEL